MVSQIVGVSNNTACLSDCEAAGACTISHVKMLPQHNNTMNSDLNQKNLTNLMFTAAQKGTVIIRLTYQHDQKHYALSVSKGV